MELLDFSVWQWLAVSLSAFLVGLTKAGFGAGAGIVAGPLMAVATGADRMLPLLLPMLIAGDVFALCHYPREIDRRNLSVLLPGCMLGVLAGWRVLSVLQRRAAGTPTEMLPAGVLNPLVGGICLAFLGIQVWRMFNERRLAKPPTVFNPNWLQGGAMGALAGLTSMLSHAAGPLIALFLLPQKLDRRTFVGTSVAFFFLLNLMKFYPFSRQGLFARPIVATALLLIPVVFIGSGVGLRLNRRVSSRGFVLIIYAITALTGLKLVFFP